MNPVGRPVAVTPVSVSYTHLDVYKRQDLKLGICYRSRRIIPNYSGKDEIIKIMKDILHEIIESPPVKIAPVLGIGIADPGIVNENTGISILTTPVSYTHLDVYKRQSQAGGNRPTENCI